MGRMKRIAAALLILALALPAFAAGEETPVYQQGETFEAVFFVRENPSAAVAATMSLQYDHDALELIPTEWVQQDSTFLLDMHGIPVGYAISAQFRVRPYAPGGVYAIEMIVEQAGDVNENEVTDLAFTDCWVEVPDLSGQLEAVRQELDATRQALEEARAEIEAATALIEQLNAEKDALAGALAEAQANAQVEAQERNASPAADFTYEIRDGRAVILKYIGAGGQVVIPQSLDGYPVAVIGDRAFYNCDLVTEIQIPSGVETIGQRAFYLCDGLARVTLPGTLREIGNSAFRSCKALAEIEIPGGVEAVGKDAFHSCAALRIVHLEEGVSRLESGVFAQCGRLRRVYIPASVSYIDTSAFKDCSRLLIVISPPDSYAVEYCQAWGITFHRQD